MVDLPAEGGVLGLVEVGGASDSLGGSGALLSTTGEAAVAWELCFSEPAGGTEKCVTLTDSKPQLLGEGGGEMRTR